MGKFFTFIERHKFGILAALGSCIGLFMYFTMDTYENTFEIEVWGEERVKKDTEVLLDMQNIEIAPQDMSSGEMKSIAKDLGDKRQASDENWDANKAFNSQPAAQGSADQRIKDLEAQFYAESGEGAKREKIKKELEDLRNKQKTSSNPTNSKTEQNNNGGSTAYSGNVMVRWELSGREPHQNNEWYVRNPGYTCGHGSNGVVFIRIKVNQNGNVISATYVPEQSKGASGCMIEQAKKYAMLSRFNYSSSASQDGKIIYTFVSQ
ncbi:MAG: hypothetical protein K0R65_1968 [Crocinitomicaceae bacterium]|jgi:hypothetical protein|nr:hypothetical protein [Crocinitomicaceae bacterium]